MTSTEETVNMDELKAEAKALNIGGWQATKDPVKLKAKIDAAKASGGNIRKKAPKMPIKSGNVSSREEMIKQLEKEDPDAKYVTKAAGTSSDELLAKGLEQVKKSNGDPIFIGNDIVCRTDREQYNKWENARREQSLQGMKSVDKDLDIGRGGKRIQALTEQPQSGSPD